MIRFLLYGLLGWCLEIAWTALYDAGDALRARRRPDPRLAGRTYLWMLPIYGLGGLIFEVAHRGMAGWPWPARGLVYLLGCWAIEYAAGDVVRRMTGVIPWDYRHARWNVGGLIRLDYAPAWFSLGLLFEQVEVLARTVEQALR